VLYNYGQHIVTIELNDSDSGALAPAYS